MHKVLLQCRMSYHLTNSLFIIPIFIFLPPQVDATEAEVAARRATLVAQITELSEKLQTAYTTAANTSAAAAV
jgi:hypothetical protein